VRRGSAEGVKTGGYGPKVVTTRRLVHAGIHSTPQFWIHGEGEHAVRREKGVCAKIPQVVCRAQYGPSAKKISGDFPAAFVREFAQRLRGWPHMPASSAHG